MQRNRNQQNSEKSRREYPSKTHSLNKRPISKPLQRKCDIYVSNKANYQASVDFNTFVVRDEMQSNGV